MTGDRPPAPHPQMVGMLLSESEQRRSNVPEIATQRPRDLGLWIAEAVKAAGYAAMLGRPAGELRAWLGIARDVGRARFATALRPDEPVTVTLLGGQHIIQGPHHGAYRDTGCWLRAWEAATILGDGETLDLLHLVPEELLAHADARGEQVDLAQVAFLKATRAPAPDRLAALAAGARHADAVSPGDWRRERASAAAADYSRTRARRAWVDEIYAPAREVHAAVLGEAGQMGATLEAALTAHRRYWTARERAMDAQGWVAWPLVAAAAAAQRRGIPVDVASDYLPLELVRGEA